MWRTVLFKGQMKKMKNCPECGSASPVHAIRDMPYTYKGRTTIIPAVAGYHCSSCGEITLDAEEVDRCSHLMGQFQQEVISDQ